MNAYQVAMVEGDMVMEKGTSLNLTNVVAWFGHPGLLLVLMRIVEVYWFYESATAAA